jgi:hypothetical protein
MSPLIVSQLRAIKDAGYNKDVDVIVHFDPSTPGAATRIYDVNRKLKNKPSSEHGRSGDGENPFVNVVMEDYVNWDKIRLIEKSSTASMKSGLKNPDTIGAHQALKNFVGYCREQHKAENYMLFLVGHGMIVGNDAFLPDEAPVSALTLKGLDKILSSFTKEVKKEGGSFQLLALHSCSMSGVEVAFQLKGTANWLISSEGTSYVGCWPYRQILKSVFNSIGEEPDVQKNGEKSENNNDSKFKSPAEVVETIYFLTLYTTRDYILGKYSLDLSMCSLAPNVVNRIKKPLQELVLSLVKGLKKDVKVKEQIQLAHLESQSYWGEEYTDLYDFCKCLLAKRLGLSISSSHLGISETDDKLAASCLDVMRVLTPKQELERFDGLIVHSDNYGWKYQYSHGLSIYFPWSAPLGDPNVSVLGQYAGYAFTKKFTPKKSWLRFLETYWDETMRVHRMVEDSMPANEKEVEVRVDTLNQLVREHEFGFDNVTMDGGKTRVEFGPGGGKTSGEFGPGGGKTSGEFGPGGGKTSGEFGKTTGEYTGGKTTPEQGASCVCPSIKNYQSNLVDIKGRKVRLKSISASKDALNDIDME